MRRRAFVLVLAFTALSFLAACVTPAEPDPRIYVVSVPDCATVGEGTALWIGYAQTGEWWPYNGLERRVCVGYENQGPMPWWVGTGLTRGNFVTHNPSPHLPGEEDCVWASDLVE